MKIAGLPSATDKAASPTKTQEVSESFSSLFLETMLQAMRKTVPKSGFMDGGNSEEIYRSMLDAEYAKIMSQTSGKSLSTMISNQISGLQKYADQKLQVSSSPATVRSASSSPATKESVGDPPRSREMPIRPDRPGHDVTIRREAIKNSMILPTIPIQQELPIFQIRSKLDNQ